MARFLHSKLPTKIMNPREALNIATSETKIASYLELNLSLKSLDQASQTQEIIKTIAKNINYTANKENNKNKENPNNNSSNSDNYSNSSRKNPKAVSIIKGLIISQKAIDKHLEKITNPDEIEMLKGLKKQTEEKLAKTLEELEGKENRKEIEEQLNEELKLEAARSSLKEHKKRMKINANERSL